MNIVRNPVDRGGRRRFILGPVEVGIAVGMPTMLLAILVWVGSTVVTRLDRNSDKMEVVGTQQAVMTYELKSITKQLEAVPAIGQQVALNTQRHTTTEKRLDRLERNK